MTYRVRRQRLTGKLVLQHNDFGKWVDAEYAEFGLGCNVEMLAPEYVNGLRDRIAKYERRAAGQRAAHAKRKQTSQETT